MNNNEMFPVTCPKDVPTTCFQNTTGQGPVWSTVTKCSWTCFKTLQENSKTLRTPINVLQCVLRRHKRLLYSTQRFYKYFWSSTNVMKLGTNVPDPILCFYSQDVVLEELFTRRTSRDVVLNTRRPIRHEMTFFDTGLMFWYSQLPN